MTHDVDDGLGRRGERRRGQGGKARMASSQERTIFIRADTPFRACLKSGPPAAILVPPSRRFGKLSVRTCIVGKN